MVIPKNQEQNEAKEHYYLIVNQKMAKTWKHQNFLYHMKKE